MWALLALILWLVVPSAARASPTNVRQVSVTNVTDTSFNVSWVTDQPIPGSGVIRYGTGQTAATLTGSASEIGMVAGARADVHDALISGLQPATTYSFYVWIAGTSYYQDANNTPYSVKTAATTTTTSPNRHAIGKVVQANGTTGAPGVLVTATIYDPTGLNGAIATSAPMSYITDSQGNWVLNLNPRTQDGSAFFQYQTTGTTSDILQVSATGGSFGDAPLSSLVLSFDSTGTFTASQALTLAAATPTLTPGTATVTLTPTSTASATATPSEVPTISVPPTFTETPTVRPSPTDTVSPTPSPPPSPTAAPPPVEIIPTPVPASPPSPPPVVPVLPTVRPSAPSLAPPTIVPIPPSPTAARPVRPVGPSSPAAAPTSPLGSAGVPTIASSPLALTFPYNPEPTPSPVPTQAESLFPTPTPIVVAVPPPDPLAPLAPIAAIVLGAVGFVGLGTCLLVVGLVHRAKGRAS